jgi:hypothetical protein
MYEAIRNYINYADFSDLVIDKYLSELKESKPQFLISAIENVYSLFLGVIDRNKDIFDRRFIYKLSRDSKLEAINSLAFTQIVSYYMRTYPKSQNELDQWFDDCLNRGLNKSAQGHIIEYYIIQSLITKAASHEFRFQVHVMGTRKTVELVMGDFDVLFFR